MYMTVAEYARQHNTTTKQVYDAIHSGKLPYKKMKDKLHIIVDDAGDNVDDQKNSFVNSE
jgi:hypothetical protein